MSDYRKIAEEALRKSKLGKQVGNVKPLNESVLYPDNLTERMAPELENDLRERKHSLGKNAAFPIEHDNYFEECIMGERFSEVAKRYKRAFGFFVKAMRATAEKQLGSKASVRFE